MSKRSARHAKQSSRTITNDDRVLIFRDLKAIYNWPYTPEHTRRLWLDGKFPKPFKTSGGKFNQWMKSTIDGYLVDLAKRRGKPEIDQDRTEASIPPEPETTTKKHRQVEATNSKRKRGRPPGSRIGHGTVHQSEQQVPKEIYTLENGKLRRFVLLKMPVYVPDEE